MTTKNNTNTDREKLKKAYKRAKLLTNIARFAIPILIIASILNIISQKYSWAMLQLILLLLLVKYLLDVKIAEKKHSEKMKKKSH